MLGSASKNRCKAVTPPADAPIVTMIGFVEPAFGS